MYLQHYEEKVIRESSILTNSYVATDIIWDEEIRLTERNQLVLYIDFTIWSLTSMELKVEFSPNEIDWYQESSQLVDSWIATIDLKEYVFDWTWKYRLAIPIKDKFLRVSAKGTWTVTSSLLKLSLITWVN